MTYFYIQLANQFSRVVFSSFFFLSCSIFERSIVSPFVGQQHIIVCCWVLPWWWLCWQWLLATLNGFSFFLRTYYVFCRLKIYKNHFSKWDCSNPEIWHLLNNNLNGCSLWIYVFGFVASRFFDLNKYFIFTFILIFFTDTWMTNWFYFACNLVHWIL